MHYKTNRLNHDFQIAYFLAGSCHTPDAAYSLLCDLRDDREDALKHVRAASKRTQAKYVKAQRELRSDDPVVKLNAEADLEEIEATKSTTEKNIAAAEAELSFINKCIEKLQPLRRFSHLSDPEAHEAAQQEEWKLELLHKAENFLLTQGTIPADHFATMRMHPEFKVAILPILKEINSQIQAVRTQGLDLETIPFLSARKQFELPALLEASKEQSK
jgi:hypothetical protein